MKVSSFLLQKVVIKEIFTFLFLIVDRFQVVVRDDVPVDDSLVIVRGLGSTVGVRWKTISAETWTRRCVIVRIVLHVDERLRNAKKTREVKQDYKSKFRKLVTPSP